MRFKSKSGTKRNYESISSLQLYDTCPKAYYLKYVMGIPEPHVSDVMHFGKSVHAGLEAYYKKQDPMKAFDKEWLNGLDKVAFTKGSPEQMRQMGRSILFSYDEVAYHFDPIEVELRHVFTPTHPFTQEKLKSPMMVVLDLVERMGIVDHKVVASAYKQEDADKSKQGSLYYMGFKDLYKRDPERFVINSIVRLKTSVKIAPPIISTRSNIEIAQFFDWAQDILTKIENEEFPHIETNRCPYGVICK